MDSTISDDSIIDLDDDDDWVPSKSRKSESEDDLEIVSEVSHVTRRIRPATRHSSRTAAAVSKIKRLSSDAAVTPPARCRPAPPPPPPEGYVKVRGPPLGSPINTKPARRKTATKPVAVKRFKANKPARSFLKQTMLSNSKKSNILDDSDCLPDDSDYLPDLPDISGASTPLQKKSFSPRVGKSDLFVKTELNSSRQFIHSSTVNTSKSHSVDMNMKTEPELHKNDSNEEDSEPVDFKIRLNSKSNTIKSESLDCKHNESLLDDAPNTSAITVKDESCSLLDASNSSFEATPKPKPRIIKKRKLTPKASATLLKKSLQTAVKKRLSLQPGTRIGVKGRITKVKTLTAAAKRRRVSDGDVEVVFQWSPISVIAERQGVSEWQAKQVIELFEQECTLPFIARYRREKTGDMQIEKLREVQNSYQQLKEVQEKVTKVIETNSEKLTNEDKQSLLSATSVQEVKVLSAGLKSSSAGRSFASRARAAGLSEAADAVMSDSGGDRASLQRYVDPDKPELATLEDVETGVKHIIADIISKDANMVTYMRNGLKQSQAYVVSSLSNKAKKTKVSPGKIVKKSVKKPTTLKTAKTILTPATVAKFENYFNSRQLAWYIKPHVMCAINRGEQQDVLTVKVEMPQCCYTEFTRYCAGRWQGAFHTSPDGLLSPAYRWRLILDLLPDCYERLVLPSLTTWVRSELRDRSELASIEVFACNLRRLLLSPPLRAAAVLAIDPGFHKGCKVAVVERKGRVLAVDTIFPFRSPREEAAGRLAQLVTEYRCAIIGIGNGTACRETEEWLGGLISQGEFGDVNVQYTVINESGASQYSITPEAREEFPDMDINHISAVSLARRLQDPLLEYVKVPAMHLGIGMYQHDVSSKLLTTSLDSVIMECVSFVGVDLNVASPYILRKVSGLNKARSVAIVQHRENDGPFRSREDLKKVKGIGPISFQQCAGFVRIVPQTLRQKSLNDNLSALCPLDSTTVHPESYQHANKLINLAQLNIKDIGYPVFIDSLKKYLSNSNFRDIIDQCGCSEGTLQTVIESLSQPLDFDLRSQFDKPLFRKGITSIADLQSGQELSGSVLNVTPFGAFVDIGVGTNGLIHTSRMNGHRVQLGNTVLVKIINKDVAKKRIGLELLQLQ